MRYLISILFLLFSNVLGTWAQQPALPAGSKQVPGYRSYDGLLWMGLPGNFFSIYPKTKVDSLFNLIQVRNLTAGDNIILNKTNPNNWIISSTGGGSGTSNWGNISGTLSNQTDLWTELSSRVPVGGNISLLNNNAGYIVGGAGAGEVRTNTELDLRYVQTELDPTVPSHVKTIAIGDITGWNNKLSGITGGTNVTINNTNPLNPVINVSVPPSGITGMLGDVTSTGTGNVVTTISNGAVTTPKISNSAVTFDKIQNIDKGRLMGLGGGTPNPWGVSSPDLGAAYPFPWEPISVPSGQRRLYMGSLYRSNTTTNTSPPPNSQWNLEKANVRGVYDSGSTYTTGETVYYESGGTAKYYTTTSIVTGIAPDAVIPSSPGTPTQIALGPGFVLGEDNVLRYNSTAGSITGMLVAGDNMTITGSGTLSSPYRLNAVGGSGGATSLSALSDVDITGAGAGQVLSYTGGVWRNVSLTSTSVFSRSANGLVPAPGGSSTTRVLHEDGLWKTPAGGGGGITAISQASDVSVSSPTTGQVLTWNGTTWVNQASGGGSGGGGISALTGDIQASGSGSVPATISNGVVTNAKLANMPANTIKGRLGTSGAPQDLTGPQVLQLLNKSFALSGTTVNHANGSKQYATISANTSYSLTLPMGADIQVQLTNSGSSTITVNFSGAVFPSDADGTIAPGKTVIFSITNISGTSRIAKVTY